MVFNYRLRNGYGWGNTTDAVHGTISATRERVQDHDFKHNVGMATSVAGAETFGINQNNLSRPQSDIPMDNLNADSVTDPAQDIRNRNRTEESGRGAIHTTTGGIAKDMAGLNKNTPPRPTHDYYRNQSFYHEESMVEPQRQDGGIVLPSGRVLRGDTDNTPSKSDEDFLKGSVFEEK